MLPNKQFNEYKIENKKNNYNIKTVSLIEHTTISEQ